MIHCESNDGVELLTLEHGKVNALDVELLTAIGDRFREWHAKAPGAVVLTGSGRAFSAGVDLRRLVEIGPEYADALLDAIDACLLSIFEAPFPVVAAINGHAIAGGFLLACACDHRLMAEGGGRVGVPELLVGVQWPTVPLEIVRQSFAPNRVQELVLLGRTHGGEEALERGLIDGLVPADELIARATRAAREMGSIPAGAYSSAKAMLRQPALARIKSIGAERDETVRRDWCSAETLQTIRAYLDRTVGRKG